MKSNEILNFDFSNEDQKEVIKGKRVSLRSVNLNEDIALLYKWFIDSEINEYFSDASIEAFKDKKKFEDMVFRGHKNGNIIFIIENDKGKPIGMCELSKDDSNQNFYLVTSIGEKKDYGGKGCGREASSLIIDYGFKELGIDSIYSTVHEHNERSKKMLKYLGFQEEKKIENGNGQDDKIVKNGQVFKRLHFKLLKEDWDKNEVLLVAKNINL